MQTGKYEGEDVNRKMAWVLGIFGQTILEELPTDPVFLTRITSSFVVYRIIKQIYSQSMFHNLVTNTS